MTLVRVVLPVVLVGVIGCGATKPTEPALAAPIATTAPAPAQPAGPATPAQTAVKIVAVHPLDDPTSLPTRRSIFFAFDSAMIEDVDRPLLEAHAKYLASNHSAKVRIEGNADERGGREYNLALGRRRAEAVLKFLTLLGVPAGQLEAISFGKEKPVDERHNETARAMNRRAYLNYLAR